MIRILGVLLRFAISILLLALFLGLLTVSYTRHEAHRATALLAEIEHMQVGNSEDSALPTVRRYGGFKWTPEPLAPKEQWIEQDEYEYQKSRVSDYKYEITISPFGTMSRQTPRLKTIVQALHNLHYSLPLGLRGIFGLRDWGTTVELSIRRGTLQSISEMTLVEGRTRWLGHEWDLTDLMPHRDMSRRTYVVGTASLTMGNGGGVVITNFFTPAASLDEVQIARSFSSACLTSVRGCDGLCDFAPRALEYLKQNPDAAWGIIPPNCGDVQPGTSN